MAGLISRPVSWFKPDPNQPRKAFDEGELRLLGESLKKQQRVPVLSRPDGTLIDGERRWRAAKLAGVEQLDAVLCEGELTPQQILDTQLITALHRADLKPVELFTGCEEWLRLNPGATAKDLAARLDRDPSWATRMLSLTRCIPAVREAAEAGRLGPTDWYAISRVSDQEQHALLAAKLNGASRDQVVQRVRQARRGGTAAVKVNRMKLVLPSRVTITAAGEALSLDDLVEALGEAQKQAKKAIADGLDARTFQAVLRDKANAGR